MICSLSQASTHAVPAGENLLLAVLAMGAHPCVNTLNIGRACFPNTVGKVATANMNDYGFLVKNWMREVENV